MYDAKIGERIKALREEKDLTLAELAKELDTVKSSLSYIENGKKPVKDDLIVKICDYFDVSADYLLGRTDIKTLDFNVREISEQTGLSERAVERIMIQNDFHLGFEIEPMYQNSFDDMETEFCHFDMNEVVSKTFEGESFWDLLERIRMFLHASQEKALLKLKYVAALDKGLKDITEAEISELRDYGKVSKCINDYDLALFRCERGLRTLLGYLQVMFDAEPYEGSFIKLYKLFDSHVDSLQKKEGFSLTKAGDPDGNDQKEE